MGLVACLCWLVAPASAGAESITRTSDQPSVGAQEAWRTLGLQIQVRSGYELLEHVGEIGGGVGGMSISLEPGIRLHRHVSLSATFRYTTMAGGLRWTNSLDLTGHGPWGLFLAIGGGYGGLLSIPLAPVETGVPGIDWRPSCTGTGAMALVRAGWLIPVGEVFATGPVVQSDLQWTRCTDFLAPSEDPDVRHRSVQLSWSFGWR